MSLHQCKRSVPSAAATGASASAGIKLQPSDCLVQRQSCGRADSDCLMFVLSPPVTPVVLKQPCTHSVLSYIVALLMTLTSVTMQMRFIQALSLWT